MPSQQKDDQMERLAQEAVKQVHKSIALAACPLTIYRTRVAPGSHGWDVFMDLSQQIFMIALHLGHVSVLP